MLRRHGYLKRDFEYRRQLRSTFRTAYEHFSGFRGAYPMDTGPFSDDTYALWGLAKPPDRLDWYLDSSDWTW
ncbi:hypothetical protein N7447_011075 [Penicillium robsamsonii]|uniref:uncharacterized protein n=1 Tax=Penicillium robsamsonii TaxID=1792511 RepID=UPI002546D754|nr:uncharacterized protein N7447_011075 [Penicillium robsamsonii]KAJ5807619.1 hypothetical protein N7447_011075 [Penicillium robsamsonii]